jgi:hypothetical protein
MKLLRRASAKPLGRLAPLNFLRCHILTGGMWPWGVVEKVDYSIIPREARNEGFLENVGTAA